MKSVEPQGNAQGIGKQEQGSRISRNALHTNGIGTEESPHKALQIVVRVFRNRCSTMEDTKLQKAET